MEFAPLPPWVNTIRKEVRFLRIHNAQLLRANKTQKGLNTLQKEEIKKLLREKKRLIRENEKLRRENEKYSVTLDRYEIALFDHGNFKSPQSGESKDKKKKGGQPGHKSTNRESHEDTSLYERKRVFAKSCGHCGTELSRVSGMREKLLFDIVINPQIVKLILETERQWCGSCKKEVTAQDSQSLPFTEYGINTLMLVLFLRFRCGLSASKVGAVSGLFGLPLTPSTVTHLLSQAKDHLQSRYDELVDIVRKGDLMYNDETSWMVRGKGAWMWVMATEEVTVYKAAESRGGGIFKELYGNSHANSMHDGYSCYAGITGSEKTLYCWSHMLRFSFEETIHDPPDSGGIWIRDQLVTLYQEKRKRQGDKGESEVRARMDTIIAYEPQCASGITIKKRLLVQKEGLIRALLLTPDGTNNLSERELRPLAIMRYTSSGSNTYTGMETTAILASVVRTQLKKTISQFIPDMRFFINSGIQVSSWQYKHVGYRE